eukprot:TRINITY_DN2999_c1_g1_i2.p2 TRINITY_DN2999_c1_g1~~TRINITY_DN2999_c1_g1_i2.p2  ORF type:complete len:219 (+),score=-13.74 TRINITY_DN2999_c1_g1_i2:919-1575(+)
MICKFETIQMGLKYSNYFLNWILDSCIYTSDYVQNFNAESKSLKKQNYIFILILSVLPRIGKLLVFLILYLVVKCKLYCYQNYKDSIFTRFQVPPFFQKMRNWQKNYLQDKMPQFLAFHGGAQTGKYDSTFYYGAEIVIKYQISGELHDILLQYQIFLQFKSLVIMIQNWYIYESVHSCDVNKIQLFFFIFLKIDNFEVNLSQVTLGIYMLKKYDCYI